MKSCRRRSGFARAVDAIAACVLIAGLAHDAGAGGYRYGYRHGYGYYGGDFGLRQDLTRLREQMRLQRNQLEQQIRLQEEQLRLLRQQVASQHQMTAMQACYYRLNAGMETCDDQFEASSPELSACQDSVQERNPGCATDIAQRRTRAAE